MSHCRECADPVAINPGRGRTAEFCSDACRQMSYRRRRNHRQALEQMAEQQRQERLAVEAEARRQARYLERLANVILGELDSVPMNSRLSTTQRKALAERLAVRLGTEQLAAF